MDLICTRCGEPWDNDCFHEEVAERHNFNDLEDSTYQSVAREFHAKGCEALWAAYGSKCNPKTIGSERAHVASAMADLFGDDTDGIASFMDDYDRGWL